MKKKLFYLDRFQLLNYGCRYNGEEEQVSDSLMLGEDTFNLLYPDVNSIPDIYKSILISEEHVFPIDEDGIMIGYNCYWSPSTKRWLSLG